MTNNAASSTPFYQPPDRVPLPPKDAEVITTCCDYCSLACGFKVYRWPVGAPDGGPKKDQNALGLDYPLPSNQGGWVGPNQYTQAKWNGRLHNIAVVADHETEVVNPGGGHSVRRWRGVRHVDQRRQHAVGGRGRQPPRSHHGRRHCHRYLGGAASPSPSQCKWQR